LGRDVKFMVFRLEGEELEAFNASVRSELEDKAREKGLAEGREEGRVEGIELGMSQTQEETAKRMLQDKMPLENIAKYTGLSIERIKKLS
ncbi:MAG: hypothetical protein IJ772_06570, partial [Bacilli bacterium]|nr:hypothetical protein [Bacilli bacterium]